MIWPAIADGLSGFGEGGLQPLLQRRGDAQGQLRRRLDFAGQRLEGGLQRRFGEALARGVGDLAAAGQRQFGGAGSVLVGGRGEAGQGGAGGVGQSGESAGGFSLDALHGGRLALGARRDGHPLGFIGRVEALVRVGGRGRPTAKLGVEGEPARFAGDGV